jgi:Domain of unknown function (DUF4279)
MHRYTVELRIVGKDLDPDEVTRRLGLEPSQAWRKGDRRSERSTRTAGTWSFEVLPPGRDDWPSLAEGLSSLLKKLEPIRSEIQSYLPANEVYAWCGHFTSSFDGGPTLPAALLKSLGNLGLQLAFDTYCEPEEDQGQAAAKQ